MGLAGAVSCVGLFTEEIPSGDARMPPSSRPPARPTRIQGPCSALGHPLASRHRAVCPLLPSPAWTLGWGPGGAAGRSGLLPISRLLTAQLPLEKRGFELHVGSTSTWMFSFF